MKLKLDLELLKNIMPSAIDEDLQLYLDPINEQLPQYEINTKNRIKHFLAQVAYETGSFKYKEENLNYCADRLVKVFGKYFLTTEIAQKYAKKPEQIANIVYANRVGNGDINSKDGWRFRGRGLIQLTGRDNYQKCFNAINIDLIYDPDLILSNPNITVATACWFWNPKKINKQADLDLIENVTKLVNGGLNGIEGRRLFCKNADRALKKLFP